MSRLRAPVVTPGERTPLVRLGGSKPRGSLGRTWAIASGSGGVGRSTVAAVLGSRLVFRGHTVCLVDADWTGPSLASLLDVPEGSGCSPWSGADLKPERSAEHADLRVLRGASPLAGDPSRRDCSRLLEGLAELEETGLVLDLPGGTHDGALDLWLAADQPMLVAVPERLPLEATARLLARVFARLATPWLARKLGADAARELMAEAWERCAGRSGTWMRSVARLAEVEPEELAARVGRKPLYLVLNRVRRGDDVDVGHALVTAAGHGLGLDLRFRAVLPFEDQGWIRARRCGAANPGSSGDLLGAEMDDLLERMEAGTNVPPPGNWRWSLQEAAGAAGG